ncbi:hypothetical protein Tco_0294663 [Tanacetum coccineum]
MLEDRVWNPEQDRVREENKMLKRKLESTKITIQLIVDERVAAALVEDRVVRENTGGHVGGAGEPAGGIGRPAGGAGGPAAAPAASKCAFTGFIKCNPTTFNGAEGAVGMCRWFKKLEMVFGIIECAERNKVKFAAATLQGRALTWWNSQVKDSDIFAYTNHFHELALLCPTMVEPKYKKIEAYIRELSEDIKGDVTSSRPANINEAVRMAYSLMDQRVQARAERADESNKRKWENFQGGNNNNNRNNNHHDQQNNRSFVSASFSTLINITPVKLDTSYEVELADEKIVFLIWKAFGRITRDLGSFGEETDKTTDLHQHLSRISLQWLKTASQIQRDAVTMKIKTTSHDSMTASEHTTQPII